jgi:hypothetical protein
MSVTFTKSKLKIFSLILICVILISEISYANNTISYNIPKKQFSFKTFAIKNALIPTAVVGFETIIAIVMIGAVQLIATYNYSKKYEKITNIDATWAEIAHDCWTNSFSPTVKSVDLYGSLAGAYAGPKISQKALKILISFIDNPEISLKFENLMGFTSKTIFSKFYVHTPMAFFFWELGKNLMLQAINNMNLTVEELEDLKIETKNRFGITIKYNQINIKKLLFSEKYRTRFFIECFKLFYHNDQLKYAFYRTINHDVLSGEFVSNLTNMIAVIAGSKLAIATLTWAGVIETTGIIALSVKVFIYGVFGTIGFYWLYREWPPIYKFDMTLGIEYIREILSTGTLDIKDPEYEEFNRAFIDAKVDNFTNRKISLYNPLIDLNKFIEEKRKARKRLTDIYLKIYFTCQHYIDVFKLEIMVLENENIHNLAELNKVKNIKTINKRSMDLVNKRIMAVEQNLNKINEYKNYMEQLKLLKERAKDNILTMYQVDYTLYNDIVIKNSDNLNSYECDFYNALEEEFKIVINNYDTLNRIFSDIDYKEPEIYTKTLDNFNKLPNYKNKETITQIVTKYFDLSKEERKIPDELTNLEAFIANKIAKIVEDNNLTSDYKKMPGDLRELIKQIIFIKIDTEYKLDKKTNTEIWLKNVYMFGWNEIELAKDNEKYIDALNK